MASIASIQKLLTKEDCEKILKKSVDFPVQFQSYRITKFNNNVAGFMGDHLSLTIKFTKDNSITQSTYFLKSLPLFNLNQLDYVIESGIFKKEVILYKNLLSELLKIAQFGPRCFFTKDNLIVLEDMKAKGFTMLPKDSYMSQKDCLAMLKNLARFHAATMVYEKARGIRMDQKFIEEIQETSFSFVEGKPRQRWLVSTTRCITDLIKLRPYEKLDLDEICRRLEKFSFEEMPFFIAPSKQFRNVLSHDDLWCNNLLFNENECRFVDFQMVRYNPPCFDFLMALYLNLECAYVEDHLDFFVDIYYSYLVEELTNHNLDKGELSRDEFEKSLDHYKLPAVIETVMYGTHVYVSEKLCNHIVKDFNNYNEFSFINRSKFSVKEFKENPQFRNRLSPLLTLLVKLLANRA